MNQEIVMKTVLIQLYVRCVKHMQHAAKRYMLVRNNACWSMNAAAAALDFSAGQTNRMDVHRDMHRQAQPEIL